MRHLCLALCSVLLVTTAATSGEHATWSGRIKAVFHAQCAGCHGADSPEYPAWKKEKEKFVADSKGPRMDTYAHLVYFTAWPDTGALMRRLDDGKGSGDGKAGNMYEHLGGSDEERQKNLALFKAWVGNWTLKRWKDITKEEMDGIKVPY